MRRLHRDREHVEKWGEAPPNQHPAHPMTSPSCSPGTWSGLLTCTAAAPTTPKGTALGWTGTWRTGSWRWRRWWPPQKMAACRARGPAGLWGGAGGYLCKPSAQGCSWEASELYLRLDSPPTIHALSHPPPHTVVPASFRRGNMLQFPPGVRPSSTYPPLSIKNSPQGPAPLASLPCSASAPHTFRCSRTPTG